MRKVQYNSLQRLAEKALRKQVEHTQLFKSQNRGRLDALICSSIDPRTIGGSHLESLRSEVEQHVKPGELVICAAQSPWLGAKGLSRQPRTLLTSSRANLDAGQELIKFKTAIMDLKVDENACKTFLASGKDNPFPAVVPQNLNHDLILSTAMLQRESTMFALVPQVPSLNNTSEYPVNPWLLRRIVYEVIRYYLSSGTNFEPLWVLQDAPDSQAEGSPHKDLLIGFASQPAKGSLFFTQGKCGSLPICPKTTTSIESLAKHRNVANLEELDILDIHNQVKLAKQSVKPSVSPADQRKVWLGELPLVQ